MIMTLASTLPQQLASLLAPRLEVVSQDASTLTVRARTLQSTPRPSVALDTAPLAAAIDVATRAGDEPRRWVVSFAEGVLAALTAPKGLSMKEFSFESAAVGLLMRLEGPAFALGVTGAGHAEPLQRAWLDGLEVTYWLELDNGARVLTRERFERWGVTLDQVDCGARSLLFHRTRYHDTARVDGLDAAEGYSVGDGFDSARLLLLQDLGWHRASRGLFFGVVGSADVLFVDADALDDVEALRAIIDARYEETVYPLSRAVFSLRDGRVAQL